MRCIIFIFCIQIFGLDEHSIKFFNSSDKLTPTIFICGLITGRQTMATLKKGESQEFYVAGPISFMIKRRPRRKSIGSQLTLYNEISDDIVAIRLMSNNRVMIYKKNLK